MLLKLTEKFLLFYYFLKLQKPVKLLEKIQKSMIVKINQTTLKHNLSS